MILEKNMYNLTVEQALKYTFYIIHFTTGDFETQVIRKVQIKVSHVVFEWPIMYNVKRELINMLIGKFIKCCPLLSIHSK